MPFAVYVTDSEIERLPAGRYKAVGVNVVSRDWNGYPVFAPSSRFELRATLAVAVEGEQIRRAIFSGNRSDLVRLVYAFGASWDKLPDGHTTDFLLAVEKAINSSGRSVEVVVGNGGWVNSVPAVVLPEGIYKLSVARVASLDPTDRVVVYRPYARWHNALVVALYFRIEGVLSSDETLWNGYVFRQLFGNPFDGTAVDKRGRRQPRLLYHSGTDGQKSVNAVRLERLLTAFWPEGFDYDWVEDPQLSRYSINEAENPIVVIADKIVDSGRVATAPVVVTHGRYPRVVLEMLRPLDVSGYPSAADAGADIMSPAPVAQQGNPFLPGPLPHDKALLDLLELVERLAGGPIFQRLGSDITPALTGEGIAWAKEHLVATWDRLGLPKPRRFGDLSYEQCKVLYAELSELLDPDSGEVF